MLAGLAFASSLGLAGPAAAEEEPPRRLETVRLCDPTACYVAWSVIDSDGDGVSDADEALAGTDPLDATSVPGLEVVTELLVTRQLPSFEHGLGSMIVMPDEFVALEKEHLGRRAPWTSLEGMGGFDLEGRGDTLARLGISGDLMKEHGLDPMKGFTLGLDLPGNVGSGANGIGGGSKESPLAGIRASRFDRSLYSAGDDKKADPKAQPPKQDPPPKADPPKTDPPKTDPPKDGGTGGDDELTPLPKLPHGGVKSRTTDPESGIKTTTFNDGTTRTDTKNGFFEERNGKVTKHGTKYVNPDAEDLSVVDPAAFEQWERMIGATIQTIEGWEPIGGDEDDIEDRRLHIAYIEGEGGWGSGFVVTGEPRFTTAQPEYDPNLPNPSTWLPPGGVVNGGPSGGGGIGDCSTGYCG